MSVIARLRTLAETLDPRVLHRTRVRLDEVRDRTRELEETTRLLGVRTEQLLTLQRENFQQRDDVDDLRAFLRPDALLPHVEQAIAAADLFTDPFPHCLVSDWLPPALYDTLLRAIPGSVFFADRPSHKQQIQVPPAIAPEFSRQVWEFVARDVVTRAAGPAIWRKFESHLDTYIRSLIPGAPDWRPHVAMHASDGRVMLRRPGYVIEPHRDPGWGFLTCLVYLARPGDNKEWGTQLYRVREDDKAPDETAYYVPGERCELVKSIPFRRNTMLVFLNGSGAHGASIPADAQPPDLERYLYQFRLGPTPSGIKWLLEHMPAEERARWAGLKTARVGSY